MSGDSTQAANPLDAHLGFWMRYVSNHVSGRFKRLLEAKGVSLSEWVVLRRLYDDTHISHAGLVDALGMTKGATSKILSKLEEKGLVARGLAEGSAKVQLLGLTRSGRALVPKLAKLADENDAYFFDVLDAGQRAELMTLLQTLVRTHAMGELPFD